ncbi:putative orphan protein [Pseudoalteromonas translucida]|uniref:Orphan protein n=1 Tax=Pseudoalteromonas translucida (strain TAC 125) TaxID=326442 RepID=Q3IGQ4_PSET1|nr:putative orphan protein [Pseudoalteromonas translucida]
MRLTQSLLANFKNSKTNKMLIAGGSRLGISKKIAGRCLVHKLIKC